MKILAIESSCDETSASVVEKTKEKIKILSNVTASSLSIHATTGGIIPENAAREQLKWILPVIMEALLTAFEKSEDLSGEKLQRSKDANRQTQSCATVKLCNCETCECSTSNKLVEENIDEKILHLLKKNIDAIAVTYGPGLIGSLLVGVETAKTLSFSLNKPLIPVNHLLAHLFANFIGSETENIKFPFIGLIVSGGHTDLLYFESLSKYTWLGGTRDDAAGEALDKIGRLLGLSYPAGPEIEKRASFIKSTKVKFHSPLLHEETFDFSFSGLKTEAIRFVQNKEQAGIKLSSEIINEICYAVQKAIIDVIISKTLKAAKKYNCKTILLGGGVAANETLRQNLEFNVKSQKLSGVKIFSPDKIFCTDNAAMVGAYSALNQTQIPWQNVKANPELYFDK